MAALAQEIPGSVSQVGFTSPKVNAQFPASAWISRQPLCYPSAQAAKGCCEEYFFIPY